MTPKPSFPDFGDFDPCRGRTLSQPHNWEKESIHRPAPVQNLKKVTFLCPKEWRPQTKDFGDRYGFPGFHRVFISDINTTNLESFSLRPEKFPKRFSFGGGRVRFFLLCIMWRKIFRRRCKNPVMSLAVMFFQSRLMFRVKLVLKCIYPRHDTVQAAPPELPTGILSFQQLRR